MRRVRWILRCALVALPLLAPSSLLARDAELVLKDGRRITGELIAQTPSTVTLKVAGFETTFTRDNIRELQIKLTLDEQYQQKRATLKPDDFAGRFDLARWLFDHNTPEASRLAMQELDAILRDNPQHEQAKLLRSVIADQLNKPAPTPPTPAEPRPPVPSARQEPGKADAPMGPGPKLVSKEDMALIRVFEVDLGAKPRIAVPDKTISEIIKLYRDRPEMQRFLGRAGEARFRTLDGWEQLDMLFKLQAREFYSDVMVREEPRTLREFRTKIHPNYIVRYCGSCHGEGKAPGLYLLTQRTSQDEVIFTNLMSIRRTRNSKGLPLIDKAEPARSPLLMYGLPLKDATTPHPDVRGWRHYFTGPNDPRYLEMVEWIKALWGQANTDYPVEFVPAGAVPPMPAPGAPAAPGVVPGPGAPTAPGARPPAPRPAPPVPSVTPGAR